MAQQIAHDRGSTKTDMHGVKRYSLTRHIVSDLLPPWVTTQSLVDDVVTQFVRDMERKHDRYVHHTQVEWEAESHIHTRDLTIRVWIHLRGMSVAERDIAARIWQAGRRAGERAYTEGPFHRQPFWLSPWE